MIYAVYDRATKKVLKSGIAPSTADCVAQADDAAAQAVVAAYTPEQLDATKASLGVTE